MTSRRLRDRALLGLSHPRGARRRGRGRLWRLRLAPGVREDRVDQHATMLVDQPLDLKVRLVVGLDVVEQRHVIDVLADLAVHFEVRGRALVHPERGDDVVLAERRQARLANFEPEQDLEHDGDVDDVSHEAAEDAWAVERFGNQISCMNGVIISFYRGGTYVLAYISESHFANITESPADATTGASGPDIGVTTLKAELMESRFLVLRRI